MKLLLSGSVALALIFALPAQAEGSAEAGQAKAGMCAGCHGRDGNSPMPKMYPTLAGQSSEVLQAKLNAYRKGEGSGPMVASMIAMAKPLSDEDVANLAAYFSQQKSR